ncbi:MAG: TVP38/TMEM64 family protein [Rhodospirillales bacterium]|nr:TVP38/TMEM64 family protein [Rhodospirillales bacterium]
MSSEAPTAIAAPRGAAKALKPALMAGGLIAVAAALPLMGHGAAQETLTSALAQGGLRGQTVFLLLSTFLIAIGLPRQIPAFAAGYAFGPWYGTAIALVAQILACSLDFIWARAIAQDFCRRKFGAKLAWVDRTLARHPFTAALMLRLMPIGNNLLLNLAAGLTSVRMLPFLAASAIGFIPQTIVFALLGKGSAPNHAHLLMLGGVTFLLSALLGLVLLRRNRAAI